MRELNVDEFHFISGGEDEKAPSCPAPSTTVGPITDSDGDVGEWFINVYESLIALTVHVAERIVPHEAANN
jgi:hypothetical protein